MLHYYIDIREKMNEQNHVKKVFTYINALIINQIFP